MTCSQTSNVIILHSNELEIDTNAVVIADGIGKVVPVIDVWIVPKKQLVYVISSQNMKSGDEYVLTIPFMGNITGNLKGYYKSSYVDKETNQTRFVIREIYYLSITMFGMFIAFTFVLCERYVNVRMTFMFSRDLNGFQIKLITMYVQKVPVFNFFNKKNSCYILLEVFHSQITLLLTKCNGSNESSVFGKHFGAVQKL